LACFTSEEADDIVYIPEEFPTGKYILNIDPLDGSSNIDVNVSVGTIFSIFKRTNSSGSVNIDECLQAGNQQVCAGYILYGSSTMLVYTTGQGVHGFTLDPTTGDFLLSHPDITIPEQSRYYSINESYTAGYSKQVKALLERLKSPQAKDVHQPYSARWIGSAVADFHRNLLKGGVYMYPETKQRPEGKIRLLFEAFPLAMLIEQAGGVAIDGQRRILDIKPDNLHQRTPVYLGSQFDIELITKILDK
jgi:fructose-1,6-bisphosphatase I